MPPITLHGSIELICVIACEVSPRSPRKRLGYERREHVEGDDQTHPLGVLVLGSLDNVDPVAKSLGLERSSLQWQPRCEGAIPSWCR